MKWALFALALVGILPLAGWIRANPHQLSKVWILIGAIPFIWGIFPRYEIAILGDPEWPSYAKGFNVSAIDLIIWAVYLGTFRSAAVVRGRLPFKLTFSLYTGAVLLSAIHAQNHTASLYYAWQLIRVYIVYVVAARACTNTDIIASVLKGMALGLYFQTAIVFWQRFILHYLHVGGTFGHQNAAGFAMHFVIFPFLALLLSGERSKLAVTAVIVSVMNDFITISRAAVGLLGFGSLLLFLLSMLRKWTSRKVRIFLNSVIVLILLLPLAYRQFELRYSAGLGVGFFSTEGRDQLVDAARFILADHPWGIGANNFFVVAASQGYYERAGVTIMSADLMPHNAYWVTAADIGYVGLMAFILFLIRPLMLALIYWWKNPGDQRGDLLLGLAISLIAVCIHSYYEWIFLSDRFQYLFAINIGMIAGLVAQLSQKSRRPQKKKGRPALDYATEAKEIGARNSRA